MTKSAGVDQQEFTHLHLHTQYSLLDGAILIDRLIPRAKELGMKSIAITDHGAMYGVVDFYNACKKEGIKPIIGCEVYISPTTRHERDYSRGDTSNYHLILLAENDQGFYNLKQLVTLAQLEGFYMRPRIDKEILKKYSEGIIGLSACLGGEIAQKILTTSYEEAKNAALEYQEILGEGNYFLEIQKNGIPEQTIVNKQLENISKETGIPLVATCDCHYLNKGDHESHTVLMGIQTGTTISQPNRLETASEELYFKSPEEMHEAFSKYPEAIVNVNLIADRCNVNMVFGELHLPTYDIPEHFETPDKYFIHLAKEGLNKRLERVPKEKHSEYFKRLDMEIEVIRGRGYVGYFLIVWDFISYSREKDIPVGPGRGSGAGSLVAYSLKITDIDPIKVNLLFERFLNPERPSLPDFDIDFCVKRRDEVIQYVRDKYGSDKVAQIITFGRLSGRSVVRDVCRVLEIPLSEADRLAKSIPGTPGMTLTKALIVDPTVQKEFDRHPNGVEILHHSTNLEGLLRHAGMHAAGVVIADRPLSEYVPLCRGKGKDKDEEIVLAQYEKDLLEDLGLVKFDFLGLANLTIIADTIKRIHKEVDPNFDIDEIPYDELGVYEMLSQGNSTGVFQFESDGMRRLMRKLQPEALADLTALNALFRPGPIGSGMLDVFCDRKHGIEPIVYPLPILEEILAETYGIIVYQEQVMQIAQLVAGYSLGSADILRRAMGRKDHNEMQQQKQIFIEGSKELNIPGAKELGYDVKASEEIFSLMAKFAEYGFNKSHSAAYAVVAYQTAYLRYKYSPQFLSAAMSAEESNLEKIIPYIDDARNMGLDVNPPNVNISGAEFTYKNNAIWFGMRSIKNVGSNAIDHIIEEREENGPYRSIYCLCSRIDLRIVNRKVLESLIYAGGFDCFGKNRNQHLNVLDSAIERAQLKQKMRDQGMRSIEEFLFDDEEVEDDEYYPDVAEMPDSELLLAEKTVLSIYFTSHPVKHAAKLTNDSFYRIKEVLDSRHDSEVLVLGIVKSMRRLLTNKNNPHKKKEHMASFILEDLSDVLDCVAFPRVYDGIQHKIEPEQIVVASGQWKNSNDRPSLHIKTVYTFEEALEQLTKGLRISLKLNEITKESTSKLYSLLNQHPGDMDVTLSFKRKDGYSIEMLLPKCKVKPTETIFTQLREYFGKDCFEIITDNRKNSSQYMYEQFYVDEELNYDEQELENFQYN